MRRLLMSGCVVVCVVGSAWAQTAPNMLAEVERVTAADPARFACAHSGRPCEADWIKAVAAHLHAIDPKWGLNAKRDGPASDLSLDVVTYRIGPTDRHVLAFDICGACGSSSARAVWSDITNRATIGQPGTARWIRPEGGSITPPPPPTSVDLQPVLAALAALSAKVDALAARPTPVVDLSDVTARLEALAQQVDIARQDIQVIATKPVVVDWPVYSGSLYGRSFTMRPQPH